MSTYPSDFANSLNIHWSLSSSNSALWMIFVFSSGGMKLSMMRTLEETREIKELRRKRGMNRRRRSRGGGEGGGTDIKKSCATRYKFHMWIPVIIPLNTGHSVQMCVILTHIDTDWPHANLCHTLQTNHVCSGKMLVVFYCTNAVVLSVKVQ